MKVDYKHTLVVHGWIGHIEKMRENAKLTNYPLFIWNDTIYVTETGTKLGTVE